MPSELPEDVVGQGKNQKNATGEGSGSGVPAGQTPEDMGWRGEKAQKGHQGQGKKGQAGQGGPRSSDPNRQPADDAALYNEDKQGNTFYDKNTEIKRESEFHDATAAPLGDDDKKVKPENDQFGKK